MIPRGRRARFLTAHVPTQVCRPRNPALFPLRPDVLLLEQQAAVRVVRALLEAEAAHAEGIGLEGVGKSVAHKLVRRFTAGAALCALIEEERVEDRSAGVAGQMVLASRVEEPGAARVVRTTGPTVRVDHQLGDVSLARSWRTLVVATRLRLGFAEAM